MKAHNGTRRSCLTVTAVDAQTNLINEYEIPFAALTEKKKKEKIKSASNLSTICSIFRVFRCNFFEFIYLFFFFVSIKFFFVLQSFVAFCYRNALVNLVTQLKTVIYAILKMSIEC